MDRDDIIERLATWFHIDPNEDGEYDLQSYDWQSGCSFNGRWLNLATIVELLEE